MQAEEIGGNTLHDALWNFLSLNTERMMNTIRGSRARIDQMITHTFPIDRIAEAMDVQLAGQCGKVIVHSWED